MTYSGAWLGVIAAAELLPSIVLRPFGGVAADRIDRYRLIFGAQVLTRMQFSGEVPTASPC